MRNLYQLELVNGKRSAFTPIRSRQFWFRWFRVRGYTTTVLRPHWYLVESLGGLTRILRPVDDTE